MANNMYDFNEYIQSIIDIEVEKRVAEVQEENSELRVEVARLKNQITDLTNERDMHYKNYKDVTILLDVVKAFKNRWNAAKEKPVRAEMVYALLKLLYVPDFEESTYECPIWLGAVTNFYSNRKHVIDILKVLDIYVPEGVENFRLPQDWTEEEVDIIFDTMGKHIVCNNCIYKGNLRFWCSNALDDVYNVCHSNHYTEIPWQFLLRNPNLLKTKYLKKIGNMAFAESYVSGWRYFFKIEDYQELTEAQLKIIINNIDPHAVIERKKFEYVNEFLLKHIDLITNTSILDQLYKEFKGGYDFKYKDNVLKMPAKYLEDYLITVLTPSDAIQWVLNRENKMTKEQRQTCLKHITDKYLS